MPSGQLLKSILYSSCLNLITSYCIGNLLFAPPISPTATQSSIGDTCAKNATKGAQVCNTYQSMLVNRIIKAYYIFKRV